MGLIKAIKDGKLIRGGILLVLAISPLPFGSVQIGVFSWMEMIILALFALWLVKVWMKGFSQHSDYSDEAGWGHFDSNGHDEDHHSSHGLESAELIHGTLDANEHKSRHRMRYRSRILTNPLNVVLGLLLLLIIFQLIPWPRMLINFFSSATDLMYQDTLPNPYRLRNLEGLVQATADVSQNRPEGSKDIEQVNESNLGMAASQGDLSPGILLEPLPA
ncbi:MAG: hypothetical protein HY730_00635 [Candidatus Tectomicrobia bacterium]|uniref:Uncharacterized protein n=1 Tax=Tectimicrobiota bacterium TaxID=2528274 RepID=A0A933GK16_UNCTE|nr:hypothetical protein [Candidatus Tectomicrobia bacterium]